MNDMELLAELIGDLGRDLRLLIEPLTAEQLAWQPGPQANSIGVTLWHIGRGLDLLAVRVLQNKPPEEELWHSRGWSERTGYDPHGHGYGGWGVLTGYTWEEVLAIPALSAGELLEYLDQTSAAVTEQVRQMDSEMARRPAPGLLEGRLTYYRWIKEFYKGFQAHVGEIVAILELMSRSEKSER